MNKKIALFFFRACFMLSLFLLIEVVFHNQVLIIIQPSKAIYVALVAGLVSVLFGGIGILE